MAPNDFVDINAYGLIQMIWVEPQYRRTKLARALVEHMEEIFKNLNIPYCEISYSVVNNEAKGFWKKMDYSEFSTSCRKFLN